MFSDTRSAPALVVLCLLTLAPEAGAQEVEDYFSATIAGQGGASVATSFDASALTFNPAALALSKGYRMQTDYRYDGSMNGNLVRISAVDGSTSAVVSGFALTYGSGTEAQVAGSADWVQVGEASYSELSHKIRQYQLGAAVPLGIVAVGVGLDWYRHADALPDELDDAELTLDFTLHAGTVVSLGKFFKLGVAGSNLIPTHRPERPVTGAVGLGASVLGSAAAELDVVANFTGARDLYGLDAWRADQTEYDVRMGLMVRLAKLVPVSFGYQTDHLNDRKFLTGGVGFDLGQLHLQYALRYGLGEGTGFSDRVYHYGTVGFSIGN